MTEHQGGKRDPKSVSPEGGEEPGLLYIAEDGTIAMNVDVWNHSQEIMDKLFNLLPPLTPEEAAKIAAEIEADARRVMTHPQSEVGEREGGFCTHCGQRFDSFEGLKCCPACGTRGVPCADKNQVMVSVNWHELRCLVIWAENFARTHTDNNDKPLTDVVYAIARRLENQHPDRALRAPLSLAGELRQVSDAHPNTEVYGDGGRLSADVERFKRINDAPEVP